MLFYIYIITIIARKTSDSMINRKQQKKERELLKKPKQTNKIMLYVWKDEINK